MKWLPDPSVPICRAARSRRARTGWASSSNPAQKASQPPVPASVPRRRRGSTSSSCMPRPTGMARSMPLRSRDRSPGRSFAVSEVRTALMPQPMSTPTAAGHTAPAMAITEPTVAPLP